MFYPHGTAKTILVHLLVLLVVWPEQYDCLIITSVRAGDKKFKTISFDSKFLKPLTFEKEMPTTEFRRHRVMRPPKFDIDINIPIKLPLEEEYPQEEYSKPHVSDFFFQTGEINEPSNYGPKAQPHHQQYGTNKQHYEPQKKEYAAKAASAPQASKTQQSLSYADSNVHSQLALAPPGMARDSKQTQSSPLTTIQRTLAGPQYRQQGTPAVAAQNQHGMNNIAHTIARSDVKEAQELDQQPTMMAQESAGPPPSNYQSKGYGMQAPQRYNGNDNYQQQEFVPGGFVNLQLSGPTGGPKMTYADYDREKWAQVLSQTAGAMPYPILNYQQLQNYYGGLGTFTNGLVESRYMPNSLLDKIKAGLTHFTNKFHFG